MKIMSISKDVTKLELYYKNKGIHIRFKQNHKGKMDDTKWRRILISRL